MKYVLFGLFVLFLLTEIVQVLARCLSVSLC